VPRVDTVEEMIVRVEQALIGVGTLEQGDQLVLVASLPVGAMGPANMAYLHTVGEAHRLQPIA
jgi:pyruvate kinase